MSINEIALHVDGSAAWPTRLELALQLAREHQAHLVGVGVKMPLTYLPIDQAATVYVEIEADARRELEQNAERFKTAMRKAGYEASAEWRESAGEPASALALSARYADLCIVSQGDSKTEGSASLDMPAALVLASGRPVLVVPFAIAPLSVGKRILIAWNGSREAARALGDSLPLLARADDVHVLTISERGSRDPQAYDVARYLARHGLRAETHALSAGELSPASVVLNTASDLGTDLLVMGCYGHTRLREALFGGVTREMLRSMTIPVLMSS